MQGFSVDGTGESLAKCFDSLPVAKIEAFLALGQNDTMNLETSRAARACGIEHVLTFVTDPLLIQEFRKLGVQTFTMSLYLSSLLALMARNPALFELMTSTTDDRDLREMILMNTNLHGKRLSEVRFPGDLLLLAIRRNDEVIVPHGTTRLAFGDHLAVLGDLDVIQMVEDWTDGK